MSTFKQLEADLFDGVVVFTSKNCGPCARVKPMLEQICDKHAVPLIVLDIHENIDAARALGLRGAPSVVVMELGAGENIHTGDTTSAALFEKLRNAGAL